MFRKQGGFVDLCMRCNKQHPKFGSKFCPVCSDLLQSLYTPGYGPKDFRYGISGEYHPDVLKQKEEKKKSS